MPVAEPRALIEALLAGKDRIAPSWSLASPTLPKPAVKTLLNFALIAIEALVRGGTMDIAAEARRRTAPPEIVVRASGPRIAFDPVVGQRWKASWRRANCPAARRPPPCWR
jgi:histidine phosphotransferase ChpT